MPPAPPPLLRTDRLVLRRWREEDHAPFAAVNADPEVMRYFPSTRSRAESEAMIAWLEVGWRLARSAWGHGFATEAASASITDGLDRVGLGEVWSWTAVVNEPSQRVMRRLGMREHTRGRHPHLPADDWLAEHVTYHLGAADWARRVTTGFTQR